MPPTLREQVVSPFRKARPRQTGESSRLALPPFFSGFNDRDSTTSSPRLPVQFLAVRIISLVSHKCCQSASPLLLSAISTINIRCTLLCISMISITCFLSDHLSNAISTRRPYSSTIIPWFMSSPCILQFAKRPVVPLCHHPHTLVEACLCHKERLMHDSKWSSWCLLRPSVRMPIMMV